MITGMTDSIRPDLLAVASFLKQGDLDNAKAAFRKLPYDDINTENDLMAFGLIALQLQHIKAAGQIFQKATKLFPENAAFQNNLGTVYLQVDQVANAKEYFSKAKELDPSYAVAWLNYGTCLERVGQLDEAKECFAEALSLDSNLYQVHIRFAIVAERQNDLESLNRHAKLALQLTPKHPDTQYVACLMALRNKQPEQALQHIQNALAIAPEHLAYLFLKGRCEEAMSHHEQALQTYKSANEKARPPLLVTEKAMQDHHAMMAFYKKMQPLPASASVTNGPIFILGLPRSGTTVLARLLNEYQQITDLGELDVFEKLYAGWVRHDSGADQMVQLAQNLWQNPNETLIADLKRKCSDLIIPHLEQMKTPFYIDKGINNWFFLPLIAKMYPNALYLFIVRDGREVAWSNFRTYFKEQFWFKHNMVDCLTVWEQAYLQTVAATEALGLNCSVIKYEGLVAKPRETLEPVLQKIGIAWDDKCLDFYKSDDDVSTASYQQVKQPLHRDNIKTFQTHFPELSQQITEQFNEALKRLGYC